MKDIYFEDYKKNKSISSFERKEEKSLRFHINLMRNKFPQIGRLQWKLPFQEVFYFPLKC